ncbi:glycosyl transferase [Spirochaetia bacterium]|nr:glycosyl transferase [Spirochaetia bacterium]
MNPKVSVIIPIYNTAPYLRRCLNSVSGQTLQDIEIICVNDGSTDNSLEILREYEQKDRGVRVIDFAGNKGVSAARNAGIDAAVGEYIGFVDSDDYVEDTFYEKLYSRAKTTDADAAKGSYKNHKDGQVDYSLNEQIKENKTNFAFTFSSGIYRTVFIKKNKINFPELMDMEDPVFAFKVALSANKVEVVDDVNIFIVGRENSATFGIPSYERVVDKCKGLQMIFDLANNSSIVQESYGFVTALWFCITFGNSFKNRSLKARVFVVEELLRLFKEVKYMESFANELNKRYGNIFSVLEKNDPWDLLCYHENMRILGLEQQLEDTRKHTENLTQQMEAANQQLESTKQQLRLAKLRGNVRSTLGVK